MSLTAHFLGEIFFQGLQDFHPGTNVWDGIELGYTLCVIHYIYEAKSVVQLENSDSVINIVI